LVYVVGHERIDFIQGRYHYWWLPLHSKPSTCQCTWYQKPGRF
jgi:hypothetical protein